MQQISEFEVDVSNVSNVEFITPIKKSESSIKIGPTNSDLLTYSTPYPQVSQQISALQSSTIVLSAIRNKTPILTHRRPRINFHSIEDLASSYSNSDSGYSSSSYSDETDDTKEENWSTKRASGKQVKTTFTEHQKRSLDEYFKRNPYPDPRDTEEISKQLVLPEIVIKVWFQNKRSRDKQRKFSQNSRSKTNEISQSLSTSSFQSPLVDKLQMIADLNYYAALFQSANNSAKLHF